MMQQISGVGIAVMFCFVSVVTSWLQISRLKGSKTTDVKKNASPPLLGDEYRNKMLKTREKGGL